MDSGLVWVAKGEKKEDGDEWDEGEVEVHVTRVVPAYLNAYSSDTHLDFVKLYIELVPIRIDPNVE
jgi:hypothetical protein